MQVDSAIKKEMAIWKNYIFNNLPIAGEDARIQCTYAECWAIPFKFASEKLASYSKHAWLYLRLREVGIVQQLVDNNIADTLDAIGQDPNSFEMTPAKKYLSYAVPYGLNKYDLPIGQLTGNYYFDIYGYCWYEMKAYYLFQQEAYGWVRETAIKYESKDDCQDLIDKNRAAVENMRNGINAGSKTKLLTWGTVLTFLLSR